MMEFEIKMLEEIFWDNKGTQQYLFFLSSVDMEVVFHSFETVQSKSWWDAKVLQGRNSKYCSEGKTLALNETNVYSSFW